MLHPKAGATKFPSAWLWQEMSVNLARSSPMHCSGVSQKSLGRAQGQGSNWASWGARCAPPLAEGSPLLLWSTAGYLHFCPTSHVTPTQNLSQVTAAARRWPSMGFIPRAMPSPTFAGFSLLSSPNSRKCYLRALLTGISLSPGNELSFALPWPPLPLPEGAWWKSGCKLSPMATLETNALPKSRKGSGFCSHRNNWLTVARVLHRSGLREAVARTPYTFCYFR